VAGSSRVAGSSPMHRDQRASTSSLGVKASECALRCSCCCRSVGLARRRALLLLLWDVMACKTATCASSPL
jgi:hypothetical protein